MRFGRIDVAINNAGTEGTPGPISEPNEALFKEIFDSNVLGVFLSAEHEFRIIAAQKNGSIVNVSSSCGHIGAAGASLYTFSKHAVEGLTKSIALEGAKIGVRVNAVSPGPTQTGMFDRFTAAIPLSKNSRSERCECRTV